MSQFSLRVWFNISMVLTALQISPTQFPLVIVFCCVNVIFTVLYLDQEERTKAIEAFKEGKKDVLVATDVASKGLDFPAIQHVVNYDMPEEIENYGKKMCICSGIFKIKTKSKPLYFFKRLFFNIFISALQSTELEELDDRARLVLPLHLSIKAVVRTNISLIHFCKE